jgi:hypothetical protein
MALSSWKRLWASRRSWAAGVLIILAFGAPASWAQSDAERDALRAEHRKALAAEAQVEQLTQDNQALRQQAADEKAHAEALRQKAEDAGGEVQKLNQALADTNGKMQAERDEARGIVDKWRSQYEALVEQAKKIDAERHQFAARAVSGERALASCADKNGKLYKIGLELIARYKSKGIGDVLGDEEPFLKMSRVQMENLMQDYEDKLYDQKLGVAPSADEAAPNAEAPAEGKPSG